MVAYSPEIIKRFRAGYVKAAARAHLEAQEWRPTHRHRKGGFYRVLHRAILEATEEIVVVYEGEDRTIWVRPEAEFEDGRFLPIVYDVPPPSPAPSSTVEPLPIWETCPECRGKGRAIGDDDGMHTCWTCKGDGLIDISFRSPAEPVYTAMEAAKELTAREVRANKALKPSPNAGLVAGLRAMPHKFFHDAADALEAKDAEIARLTDACAYEQERGAALLQAQSTIEAQAAEIARLRDCNVELENRRNAAEARSERSREVLKDIDRVALDAAGDSYVDLNRRAEKPFLLISRKARAALVDGGAG